MTFIGILFFNFLIFDFSFSKSFGLIICNNRTYLTRTQNIEHTYIYTYLFLYMYIYILINTCIKIYNKINKSKISIVI